MYLPLKIWSMQQGTEITLNSCFKFLDILSLEIRVYRYVNSILNIAYIQNTFVIRYLTYMYPSHDLTTYGSHSWLLDTSSHAFFMYFFQFFMETSTLFWWFKKLLLKLWFLLKCPCVFEALDTLSKRGACHKLGFVYTFLKESKFYWLILWWCGLMCYIMFWGGLMSYYQFVGRIEMYLITIIYFLSSRFINQIGGVSVKNQDKVLWISFLACIT